MEIPPFNLPDVSGLAESISDNARRNAEQREAVADGTIRAADMLEVTVVRLDDSVRLQIEALRLAQAAAEESRVAAAEAAQSAKQSNFHAKLIGYLSIALSTASLVVAVAAVVAAS